MKRAGLILLLAGAWASALSAQADAPAQGKRVDLVFSGGHDTDPRDRGRPVALIATALGVPPEVFREAFTHVHPAPAGERPDEEEVRQNKRELMARLGPYGVTNERLNEVSNYYRYRREAGELWRHVDAAGYAIVQGGRIVSITLTNPGAGYTTPPKVSLPGVALTVYPVVVLAQVADLAKNGSIARIDLAPVGDGEVGPN